MTFEFDETTNFDEDTNISLLPLTMINFHEKKNPFSNEAKTIQSEKPTPRYSLLPKKTCQTNTYPMSAVSSGVIKVLPQERSISTQNICLIYNDPIECNTATTKVDDSSQRKHKKDIKIVPYQQEFNRELRTSFKQLSNFKGINKELLQYHNIKLRKQEVNRKTLVLDLDGTLICNIRSAKYDNPNVLVPIQGNKKYITSFIKRPYVEKLLKSLRLYYEIIVFTAAKEEYGKDRKSVV